MECSKVQLDGLDRRKEVIWHVYPGPGCLPFSKLRLFGAAEGIATLVVALAARPPQIDTLPPTSVTSEVDTGVAIDVGVAQ